MRERFTFELVNGAPPPVPYMERQVDAFLADTDRTRCSDLTVLRVGWLAEEAVVEYDVATNSDTG